MRAVTLSAGDNGLPRLPTELAGGDALTEVHGPVLTADAPDLEQRGAAGWQATQTWGFPSLSGCGGSPLALEGVSANAGSSASARAVEAGGCPCVLGRGVQVANSGSGAQRGLREGTAASSGEAGTCLAHPPQGTWGFEVTGARGGGGARGGCTGTQVHSCPHLASGSKEASCCSVNPEGSAGLCQEANLPGSFLFHGEGGRRLDPLPLGQPIWSPALGMAEGRQLA